MRGGGGSFNLRLPNLAGFFAMRFFRLVTLLLAAAIAFTAPATAATLTEALQRFTADDFSETAEGVTEVAGSGDARAAVIIEALQDRRLVFSAEKKSVFIKDKSDKLFDAATGQPAADVPGDLEEVRINNRLRR